MNQLTTHPILKLSFCLFLLLFFAAPAANAQSPTISVEFKNTPPSKALETIEFNSSYRFVYQEGLDLSLPLINLSKKDADIDEVLKEMAVQTGLEFQRNGMNIAVSKKEEAAQQGKGGVSGKVVDEIGQPLLGATIQAFPGNHYAVTDNNGDFSIELPVGTYTLEIRILGYQPYRVEGVEIKKGETIPLNVSLTISTEALEQVMITTTYNPETSSVVGFLTKQRKAAAVSDGLSAEQISRTPASNLGDALKRITGVTTFENKFVVVRNLAGRYNKASLDGITLPSTEVNKQAFAFNLIPTALIDNVTVSKTVTPDMNANFAGGYVQVTTKDIPDKNFNYIKVGGSYYENATFEERITKQRGDYDYFGYDDGSRDYPAGLTGEEVFKIDGKYYFNNGPEKFTNDNFTPYTTETMPSANYQIALGRVYDFDPEGKSRDRWGFTGSLILRNTQNQQDIEHTSRGDWRRNNFYVFDGGFSPVEKNIYPTSIKYGFSNSGVSYNYTSTVGAMLNAGVQFGSNRISVRNTYTHIYDNALTRITGWSDYRHGTKRILEGRILPFTKEANIPTYQTLLQNKVEGNHHFGQFVLDWNLAHTRVEREQKDITYLQYFRRYVSEPDNPLEAQHTDILTYNVVPVDAGANYPFGRANFSNEQTNYNFGTSLSYDKNWGKFKNRFKIGYFGTEKKATNLQATAQLVSLGEPYVLDRISIAEAIGGDYYNEDFYGWKVRNFGEPYVGKVHQHSGYLMLDNRFGEILRLVWGVRAEYYEYERINAGRSASPYGDLTVRNEIEEKKWQFLPSVNLTITPFERFNIRLAYAKAVIRPSFEERILTYYYDPITESSTSVLPLVSSEIDMYDLKVEWYPSPGEVLSAALYHKKIINPIERIGETSTLGGNDKIYIQNSAEAVITGIEVAIRRNFGFLGEGEALKDLYVFGNASFNLENRVVGFDYIIDTGEESSITKTPYETNRPLVGQTPYLYNLGLGYTGDRLGFQVSYNESGRKYTLAAEDLRYEEIQAPYNRADVQLSWNFLKERNLRLKVNIKNVFDERLLFYDNKNSYEYIPELAELGSEPREAYRLWPGASEAYEEDIDNVRFKAFMGRSYSISLSYAF